MRLVAPGADPLTLGHVPATVGAGVTQLHLLLLDPWNFPPVILQVVVQSAQRLVRNVVALALLMDLPVAVDVVTK
jgi:hypothetical protein